MRNKEIVNARIFAHLKRTLSPDYTVVTARARWLGERNNEDYYMVRYFITSKRFTAGVRYDKVAVQDNTVRVVVDDEWA